MVFLYITTFGNNPLQLIPMDLEFTIIPMLVIFFMIFFDIVFLLILFLAQSWSFNCREFWFMFVHKPFTTYICQQHLLFPYITNRFWGATRIF